MHRPRPSSACPWGCPQLVVHGEADTGVPSVQSRTYVTAALERDDRAECVGIPVADHFDVIDPAHPAWQAVVRRLPAPAADRRGVSAVRAAWCESTGPGDEVMKVGRPLRGRYPGLDRRCG
ncbi:hypothetical protein CGZ69_11130 [Streptomyces peucetius subsp. caesius ATCC 27952]|nr:hypothetical protein CGZ69_11130 [Streptomyces peucetius subsp. caesius ATCC 27952]